MKRRTCLGLMALTLIAPTASARRWLGDPSVSAPSRAQAESKVTVTVRSSAGESGTTIEVEDDLGAIVTTITWNGDTATVEFTMPSYDPANPDNAVTVTATSSGSSDSATIDIQP